MRLEALAVLLAVLVTGPVLAGCIGGTDDGGDEPVRKQRADVTETLGGIEGVVTDSAVQPVVGANVTLVELDRTVQTASDGSYAFSRVRPDTYTITVNAPGFVSVQETVVAIPGSAVALDFVLTHLFTEDAYSQIIELVGFLECGVAWREYVVGLPPGVGYQSVAACAIVNLATDSNATNDRFRHFYELDPAIEEMVYEMEWDAQGSPLGGVTLWGVSEVRGFTNANGSRFLSAQGPSPLHVSINRTQFEDLQQNFTERCEESEAWCGYSFFDDGWPMQIRVFAHWDCVPAPVTSCLILQQRFTHYVSGFYNAPAPEGYGVVAGTTGT